jgi:hypothetical protein
MLWNSGQWEIELTRPSNLNVIRRADYDGPIKNSPKVFWPLKRPVRLMVPLESCQDVDRRRISPSEKKGVISKFVAFKCLILPDFLGMVLALYFQDRSP